MAKKKRRSRRAASRKRSRGMSEYPLARRGKKRSSRKRRKKGFMSEIVSHEGLKRSGKSALGGGIGGVVSYIIDRLAGDQPILRAGLQVGSAIVLGAGFDAPNVAAGVSGAYTRSLADDFSKALGLGEMERTDYADEDALDQYPDALDEDGNAMYLAEDGNFYYLEEFELAEDGNYYLSETMQAQLYPGYVNTQLQA